MTFANWIYGNTSPVDDWTKSTPAMALVATYTASMGLMSSVSSHHNLIDTLRQMGHVPLDGYDGPTDLKLRGGPVVTE